MSEVYQDLESLVLLARERKALHGRLPEPAVRRDVRIRSGLSQAELASVLNVSRQAIARWETGERRPSKKNLNSYLAVLGRLATDFGKETEGAWSNDS